MKFGVSARHFNAVRINLLGKIKSVLSLLDNHIADLQYRLKKILKTIKYLKRLKASTDKQKNKLHQKQRLLPKLEKIIAITSR